MAPTDTDCHNRSTEWCNDDRVWLDVQDLRLTCFCGAVYALRENSTNEIITKYNVQDLPARELNKRSKVKIESLAGRMLSMVGSAWEIRYMLGIVHK